MRYALLTTTILLGAASLVFGQSEPNSSFTKSEVRTVRALGWVDMKTHGPDYEAKLTTGIFHDPDASVELPAGVKINYPVVVNDGSSQRGERAAEMPGIVGSWSGFNDASFTPPDNSVAVSNAGIVVSAMNANYRVFDRQGKQLATAATFAGAFGTQFPGLTKLYYDPRVIYDSDADRFIMVLLNGNKHDNTNILIMYSKTNDPLDGWYLYSISGDVKASDLWTDYPAIAVSKDELFITGNLFDDFGTYEESFIIQMKKEQGFEGENLEYQAWTNLKTVTGDEAFSLIPCGYGIQGNYGSGMYFVCNDRLTTDIISLFHISDHMDAANEQLVRYTVNSPFTITAPNYTAQKNSSDFLNTGDARAKSGFYLNGMVHYVLSTRNSAGSTSIAYFRINTTTRKADYRVLGKSDVNYSYPSIISLASNQNDASVMIGFLSSGKNIFPEIRTVHCNSAFEFSESIPVKAGATAVNELNGTERWGDYTGFARKYNSVTGILAGCYGFGGKWRTEISEIGLPSQVAGVLDPVDFEKTSMHVYPNPTRDVFKMSFKLNKMMPIEISLYTITGQKIETLYSGTELAGQKDFSFNRLALAKGVYLLRVTGGKGDIATEKVVVE
jgi:hypothetical protein